ncbi:alkaline phosphatase family protein [Dermabacteraceae bacterium P7006]
MHSLLPPPWAGGNEPGVVTQMRDLLTQDAGLDVVFLLDGLGANLLESASAHARTITKLGEYSRVTTSSPTTTAAVLASMFTAASPREHGVAGYTVLDPEHDRALPQLGGDLASVPARWLGKAPLTPNRPCAHVGPDKFAGSLLTSLLYPGWRFWGYRRVSQRIDTVLSAARQLGKTGLLYVHVSEIDHAGHSHGPHSPQWLAALEDTDAEIAALRRRLPAHARITLLADHGMVAPSAADRVVIPPALAKNCAAIAGEGRVRNVRLLPGSDPELAAEAWQDALGDGFLVMTSESALAKGYFGPPAGNDALRPRFGDITVWAGGSRVLAEQDSPQLAGEHGSLTEDELYVPCIKG